MKTKLITSLRLAANALENKTFHYDWKVANNCNCGVVACALLGKSSNELGDLLWNGNGSWTKKAGENCPITGAPMRGVFAELHRHGLSGADIVHLEALSDPKVLARCDFGTEAKGHLWWRHDERVKPEYANKRHVIVYLRAWAGLLMEEGRADAPEVVAQAIAATAP